MAIQQTKKQSDLEKRLRLLRQQVYGKAEEKNLEVRTASLGLRSHFGEGGGDARQYLPSNSESFRTDITYLRQDLIKIAILASLAFGIQAVLFYLLQNNLLKNLL